MGHGKNNQNKTNNRDWWGKRPLAGLSVSRQSGMKFWKKLLHKMERKQGRNQIKREQDEN